jgi:uncharacterized RDD family membrane protein YckC
MAVKKKTSKSKVRTFLGTASLFKRFLSFVFDIIIINFFIVLPFRPLMTKYLGEGKSFSEMISYVQNTPEVMQKVSTIVFFISILSLLYFTIMEWKFGSTFGQKIMKLKVTSENEHVTFWQSLLNNMFILPFFPFFILWIVDPIHMLFNEEGRRFSEKIAKTKVVQEYEYT